MCLSFSQDKFYIRKGGKALEKNGGGILMVHVSTNTIIGARIIVTVGERIFPKTCIKKGGIDF